MDLLHEREVKQASNRQFVEALKKLPNEALHKLASGEMKLAYDDEGDWLQKYRGTPLFQKAVALEQQKIELDAQDQEHHQARRELEDQIPEFSTSAERDRLCLEKRILDLELATSQEQAMTGQGGEEQQLEMQEGAGLDMAQKAHETEQAKKGQPAKPPGGGGMTVQVKQDAPKPEEPTQQDTAQKVAAVVRVARLMAEQDAKLAADLTQAGRDHIKSTNFAIPKGNGPGGTGKYPIEDKAHASNALSRVDQFGSSGEKSKVYAAVAKKYPGLAARSSVPAVREKEALDLSSLGQMGQKAIGAIKPFAQTLGAGAKEVGGAFSSGGMKAGLGALKDVGGVVANSHPLGTAALAGGAGFAAGRMMGHRQQG